MPALGLLALTAPGLALAPSVAFADVPRVQLQNHLMGFEGQFESFLLLDACQMSKHRTDLLDGHLAGQECRRILDGGHAAGAFFQSQGGGGGHAPLAAARMQHTGLGQSYQRLRKAGKPAKVALTAVMRKLLLQVLKPA